MDYRKVKISDDRCEILSIRLTDNQTIEYFRY